MNPFYKIFVDFNNADKSGRVRLITKGTLDDIKNQNIHLYSGLTILLDDNEGFVTTGVVEYSEEEKIWVAIID
ncbi:hypothetical protein FRZ67_12690 [Panacibacter ginsenosidivorans]|uniref:Uncharacterized protein n=1 Tax=Panacibacter ginsenosidivorans TaxID=1813871 RepID=A0A5B8VBQ6_9BACT|nr:hypothetical protein [Panacibacter ginsenosidivorans]QEC68116.1 hypothetical protein FRZ67_12690 [Panacibacter ginsenosidivorans]